MGENKKAASPNLIGILAVKIWLILFEFVVAFFFLPN